MKRRILYQVSETLVNDGMVSYRLELSPPNSQYQILRIEHLLVEIHGTMIPVTCKTHVFSGSLLTAKA